MITVEWGRALVAWWTHSIKGLHRNDFIMASKTDSIYTTLTANVLTIGESDSDGLCNSGL